MSGQCYACGAEFGFFKKEQGCKNCGFAFCSKCLTKKAVVPKLEGSSKSKGKHHVCNKCYNILTGNAPAEDTGRRSPPEAYLKRVAALQEKEAQGAFHGAQARPSGAKVNPKYAALDKPDREIAQRLEKLKERPKEEKVTDRDLNERLARLKGEDSAARTAPAKPFYQPPDRRTQTEQINELLDEIANEVEIDSHQPDPATYVEGRLARLRDEQTGASASKVEQNNLDKNNLSSTKTFVKNIDVGPRAGGNSAGAGQSGEEGDIDFTEVQALMTRVASQMEVEAQRALEGMKKDKELMERLTKIKQRQKNKDGQTDEQSVESNVDSAQQDEEDSEDEEVAARRIMQQFLEEVKLDEKMGNDLATGSKSSASKTKPGRSKAKSEKTKLKPEKEPMSNSDNNDDDDDDDDYEDPDELPYCCICTEDAVIRCIDCGMDLYCTRCFREGHNKQLGLTDHRSVPYKAPKGYR